MPINANSKEFGYGDLKIGDPISKIFQYCDQVYETDFLGIYPVHWHCYGEKNAPMQFHRSNYELFFICKDGVNVISDPANICGGGKKYENVKDNTITIIGISMGYHNKDYNIYKNEIETKYKNLKRSLDKKYKRDFTFSEINRSEFNAGLSDFLVTCYEGCKVALQYVRMDEGIIDVVVEYSDDLIAEQLFEMFSPVNRELNTNRF